jgi:hypothetical protein
MIDAVARITHATLKRMIVGKVFTVDDQISATLDAIAKM